jgi:lycopene beta-cyclase
MVAAQVRPKPASEEAGAASDSGTPSTGLALVGGGLQNALIALATLSRNPDAKLHVVERLPRFGGNHTWCFHDGDVPPSERSWLQPLVVQSWPGYLVKFPGLQRRVDRTYSAISSERLHDVLLGALTHAPHAGFSTRAVSAVSRGRVQFDAGPELSADFVIDARGPAREGTEARHFQKFLGLELQVNPGNAPLLPTLMDACVPQRDGFRFMYMLPLAPDRVLVEDTYYSDSSELDHSSLRSEVLAYARDNGLSVQGVIREETGVLPLPTTLAPVSRAEGTLLAGYAGGFFHPTTGYSLPSALRLAVHVASHWPEPVLDGAFERLLARHRAQARYCTWLNRMLFGAFEPERRFEVLKRFYRLPEDTIERFYALEMSAADRLRIVCGAPPKGFSARRWFQARGQYA